MIVSCCLSEQILGAEVGFSADICLAQPEDLACVPKLGWPTSARDNCTKFLLSPFSSSSQLEITCKLRWKLFESGKHILGNFILDKC